MNSLTEQILVLCLGLLAGVALGVGIHAWHLQRKGRVKLYLPAKWPIAARGLVNPAEEKLWSWLREIFPDHCVMVKTPVLRFTTLSEQEKGQASAKAKAAARAQYERWMERLSGVYTTFTVCTSDGKVVGCVDVPGKVPASRTSRELKETLLSDCGIAYTVVVPSHLPATATMRAAFLGERPIQVLPEPDSESVQAGDTCFREELKSFTIQQVKETQKAALKTLNKAV